jgi:hypothetical protein
MAILLSVHALFPVLRTDLRADLRDLRDLREDLRDLRDLLEDLRDLREVRDFDFPATLAIASTRSFFVFLVLNFDRPASLSVPASCFNSSKSIALSSESE